MKVFYIILIILLLGCKSKVNNVQSDLKDCDVIEFLLDNDEIFINPFYYRDSVDRYGFDSLQFVRDYTTHLLILENNGSLYFDVVKENTQINITGFVDTSKLFSYYSDNPKEFVFDCELNTSKKFNSISINELPSNVLSDTMINRQIDFSKLSKMELNGFIQFSKPLYCHDYSLIRGEIYFKHSLIEIFYVIDISKDKMKIKLRKPIYYHLDYYNFSDDIKHNLGIVRSRVSLNEL